MNDAQTLRSFEMNMKAQQISWTEIAMQKQEIKPGASSSSNGLGVDSNVMGALQDSFDAVTRLTLSVKKKGQELLHKGALSQTLGHMVNEGVKLCKDLCDPIGRIEELLMTPASNIDHNEAMSALKGAAVPFQKLQDLFSLVFFILSFYFVFLFLFLSFIILFFIVYFLFLFLTYFYFIYFLKNAGFLW